MEYMYQTLFLMKILIALISISYYFYTVRSNSLTVVLDSKWSSTPLIAEASEYFASHSQEMFWNYVDELSNFKDSLSLDNSEMKNFEIMSKVVKKLLTSGEAAILYLSLSLRVYSPSIEMSHQLDPEIDCINKSFAIKFGKEVICNIETMKSLINRQDTETRNKAQAPLYKTDKVFPLVDNIDKNMNVIVLYGDLRDSQIYQFHDILKEFTKQRNMYYVFRHRIKVRNRKTRLSGYGVELAIKSTEYKAIDDTKISDSDSENKTNPDDLEEKLDEVQGFIFSQLKELHPQSSKNLEAFRRHLLSSDSEIRPIKTWQVQDLSLRASQLIINALETNQALETLRDISQNYPLRAHFLTTIPVTNALKQEIMSNQAVLEGSYGISPGVSLALFNGYVLSKDIDIFEIVDLARREMTTMTRLYDFGLNGHQISSLTSIQYVGTESSTKTQFLLDISSAPITFINNLEKDSRYSTWPKKLRDLLAPAYPGAMRRIAKNIFNTILVLDPMLTESRDLVKFVEAFIIHNAPIRMGFIWSVDPDQNIANSPGRALIRAFNFVTGEKDALSALGFITDFYGHIEDETDVTVDQVQNYLRDKYPDVDVDIVFGENSDYDDNIKSSWKFLHDSGIMNHPRPFLLNNGLLTDYKTLKEVGFEEVVVSAVLQNTVDVQRMVLDGSLREDTPVLNHLMKLENVVSRLNEKILDANNKRFVSFTKSVSNINKIIETEDINQMSNDNITTIISDRLTYFVKDDETMNPNHVSVWLVVDLESAAGAKLVLESLKWIQTSPNMRFAIIQNPNSQNVNSLTQKLLYKILTKLSSEKAKGILVSVLNNGYTNIESTLADYFDKNPDIKKELDTNDVPVDFLKLETLFVEKVLKVAPGSTLVLANGKILGPFDQEGSIVKNDFRLLERTCMGSYKILRRLESLFGHGADKARKLSDLTLKIHATLVKDYELYSGVSSQTGILSTSKKVEVKGLSEEHSVFSLMGVSSKPAFEMIVILDPLSRSAQILSHVILVLKQALNLNVKIILNPRDKLSEPPLKSFYRYVLDPSPIIYDEESGRPLSMSNPRAQFSRLPSQPLLTLGLEPIHNWLVEPTKSVYDLDNLHFVDIPGGAVHAHFELEYLLLEGHCVEMNTGQPPRGLQFDLNDGALNKTKADTIVMANLGYFQLKANPGVWILKLREGKSKLIYDIVDHEYTDNSINSPDVVVVIDSFRSKIIRLKVNKKPDKVHESLLSESKIDEDTASIWQSISNAFGKTKKMAANETINIFSIASGHLYERFLRIMMISVLKHTKSPVKFWFLKNYLSPTFKQFIPHMAKKYGFSYDLVQYKWPRWLHEQTEKQRLIWGYKILFLDVMFPLNVSKIIFVDADQVVRTDLKELVEYDLEGAPYGYTPFCSSRKEMDGFRFWKSGYWSMHLAGRPYHISALYVVDLNRFRLMAAGDRLRGQYHGLSQDPNSLSNLDQDLPNNMIHQVPIKSLPQEWLWCETWCSEEEKKRAKTIDLCNNPQTKEPKLKAAMRILPEWKGYDEEIKSFWNEVYNSQNDIASSKTDREKPDIIQQSIPTLTKHSEL